MSARRPGSRFDARTLAALGVDPAESGAERSGDVRINASQIAELAGVGRPAVSNWRRRHDDFPAPASRTSTGADLWRLDDIQTWLTARGGEAAGVVTAGQRFVIALNAARSVVAPELALQVALSGLVLSMTLQEGRDATQSMRAGIAAGHAGTLAEMISMMERDGRGVRRHPGAHQVLATQMSHAQAHTWLEEPALVELIASACRLDTPQERIDACERALEVHRKGLGRRRVEYASADDLSALVAALGGPAASYVDPAAGVGTMLLHAARVGSSTDAPPHLAGVEPATDRWRLLQLRMLIHGLHAYLGNGDGMQSPPRRSEDGGHWLEGEVVLCEPPFGQKVAMRAGELSEEEFSWGSAPERDGELRWVQRAIELLSDERGRGYVVVPSVTGSRGGADVAVRAELVRRGMVEAVIELGEHVSLQHAGPVSVWVVRPERAVTTDSRVLFVDGRPLIGASAHAKGEIPEAARAQIVELLRTYRADPAQFAPRPECARAVAVLEILGPETPLVAEAWTVVPPDALALTERVQVLRHRAEQARAALDAVPGPQVSVEAAADERGVCLLESVVDAGWCARVTGTECTETGDISVRLLRGRVSVESAEPGIAAAEYDGVVLRVSAAWLPADLMRDLITRSARLSGPSRSGLLARVEITRFSEAELQAIAGTFAALGDQGEHARVLADASAELREQLLGALVAGAVRPRLDP